MAIMIKQMLYTDQYTPSIGAIRLMGWEFDWDGETVIRKVISEQFLAIIRKTINQNERLKMAFDVLRHYEYDGKVSIPDTSDTTAVAIFKKQVSKTFGVYI